MKRFGLQAFALLLSGSLGAAVLSTGCDDSGEDEFLQDAAAGGSGGVGGGGAGQGGRGGSGGGTAGSGGGTAGSGGSVAGSGGGTAGSGGGTAGSGGGTAGSGGVDAGVDAAADAAVTADAGSDAATVADAGSDAGSDAAVAATVVINEAKAAGSGADYVELKNLTGAAIDLEGWKLKDSENEFTFPAGASIPANGYLALDEDATDSFTFGLGGDDEVSLWNPSGMMVDKADWASGENPSGKSFGRFPDGTGPFGTRSAPTRGAANVD